MSRIFPYDAIARKALPRPSDFEATIDDMRKAFSRELCFKGALLFGSALPARGDADAGSNVDCLVVYDWRWKEYAFAAMRALTHDAHGRNVPLQLIPFDEDIASRGFHTIGEDLGHHLSWAARNGGILKGNPLRYFRFQSFEVTENYVRGKLAGIQKGHARYPLMDKEEKLRFLGKAFDLPTYLGRKILWAKGHHLDVDSKEQVGKKYAECFPGETTDLFRLLHGLKNTYRQTLKRALSEHVCPKEYRKIIFAMEERIPDIIAFIRLNAFILAGKEA